MAKEDVNIKVSANVAEAIQMWKAMEAGPEGMAKALDAMGKKGNQAAKEMADPLGDVIGQWTTIQFSIQKAHELLKAYIEESREMRREEVDATRQLDTASRRYFQSAGIKAGTPEAEAAVARLGQMAKRTGESGEDTFSAAQLLAEFGASREAQQGDALAAMLDFGDVVDLGGGNPKEMQRAILTILKRSGKGEVNAQAIHQLAGTAAQLMSSGSGFDIGRLQEYQTVSQAVKDAGVDYDTGLQMWAALREQKEMRQARPEFLGLFDKKIKPGEAQRRAQLEARGQELAAMGGLTYEERIANANGAMIEAEASSAAEKQFSDFAPGVISEEFAREQLINTLRSEYGRPKTHTGRLREQYARAEYGTRLMFGQTPEQAAYESVSNIFVGPRAETRLQQEIRVRIQGPDGLDIPTEPAATGLNQ